MIGSRAWLALMRRNWIYRRRYWVGSLLEILLLMGVVGILVAIKAAYQNSGNFASQAVKTQIPTTQNTFAPLVFADYVTALHAHRTCVWDPASARGFSITGLPTNGENWQVPLLKCYSYACQYDGQDATFLCEAAGIAVAPSRLDDVGGLRRAMDFVIWLYKEYPELHPSTGLLPFPFVRLFESPQAMDDYVTSVQYGTGAEYNKIAMGIVWHGNDDKNWHYTLRQNSTNFNSPENTNRPATWTTPDTARLFDAYARNDSGVCIPIDSTPKQGWLEESCTGQYVYNGILTFQRLVGDFILHQTGSRERGYGVAQAGVQFVQFPTQPYQESGFYAAMGQVGPMLVTLGILYPVASMISYIVSEKELQQKELMKMMSVMESDIGWSWFVTFGVWNLISTTVTTAMSTQFYENSQFGYLWIFWFLTLTAVTVFSMLVATFSSKSARAVVFGLLVFFIGVFLTIAIPIDYRQDDGTWVGLISLHPVAAFSYGLQEIGRLEDQGTGLQRNTINYTESPSGYTFQDTIRFFIMDCILWGIVTWYLNRVIKPDYGQALPLWFPLQCSYWFPTRARCCETEMDNVVANNDNQDNIPLEPVSDNLKRQTKEGQSIELHGLRKVFGDKVAVDDLCLSMYRGQITAMLGHNGAGKTTIINMLTGALAPTAGYATVAGKDIRTQMSQIRQDIGICLQHNCLFPQLTVREHVQFYSRIKGVYSKTLHQKAEEHVDQAIQDVALSEKRHSLAKNLSGGMKRKLSVAIAFCGNSQVVMLDEPTSGMDPFSRRFTWNIIMQYRPDRCIILTTHHMDEADILGDRIAILSEGRLRCAGSSLFLKKTYGVGYQLTIEKQKGETNNARPLSLAQGSCEGQPEESEEDVPNEARRDNGRVGDSQQKAAGAPGESLVPEKEVPNETSRDKELDGDNGDAGNNPQKEACAPKESLVDLNETFLCDSDAKGGGDPDRNVKDETSDLLDDSSDTQGGDYTNDIEGKVAAAFSAKEHSSATDDERLQTIVKSAVADASLLSNVGSEMSFQLPMGAASQFAPMFEGLDREVELEAISSYGVSITTLDEVFLLVARGNPFDQTSCRSSRKKENESQLLEQPEKSVRSRMDLQKDGLFTRHLGALFKKRAAYFRRDKKAWLCTTVLPSIFVCLGFIIFTYVVPERSMDPVTLDLNDYNPKAPNPRNPIVFNSPDNPFLCQPGFCAYQEPVVFENTTRELYYFCGYRGRMELLENTSTYNCTIAESSDIVEWITDSGAVGIPANVENISDSSESLLSSSSAYAASQYGAILFTHDSSSQIDDVNSTNYTDIVIDICRSRFDNYSSADACSRFKGLGYVIQYNFTALHVAPLYQALADEALVRQAMRDDEYNIQCNIAPLPITSVEHGFGNAEDAFSAWFLVVFSFPFISGAFASFVVAERQSKAKHLQTVAGVKPSAYWLSTYLWDVLNYQIPLWIVVMLMFAFDVDVLTTTERHVCGGVIALLFFFGPASAGFTYCISYAFTSASHCNMFVIIFGFLIGVGGTLTCFILTLLGIDPGNEKENLLNAVDILTWILRFFPQFCLGKGLFNAINITFYLFIDGDLEMSAWSEPVLLYEVIFLAWQSVVFLLLAIQLDKWSTNPRALKAWQNFLSVVTFRWIRNRGDKASFELTVALPEDDDVMKEQDRVLSGDANDDLIVMSQLTKVYDNGKVAVNDMSLGIPPGQCFGLLGTNGAGKTTNMGMLTAEFPPTSGDATLAGYSVSNEPQKTRRHIGYCPQFNAHFANLTGREHVELYASIKGVPKKSVKEAAAAKLAEVGLSESDSGRLSSGYSGGMKRRLSLACATIGQPQIVFLDECTTGVDPIARREIWQLISDMVAAGNFPDEERTSVILTTHSIDECEALCPRIGIMANGRLRCLGSAQHLKNKFGKGYQIEMKVRLVDRDDDDFVATLASLVRTKESTDEEAAADVEDVVFTLDETLAALESLTGNKSISDMVTSENPAGYIIWKDSSSGGVAADDLAAFATSELRMRKLDEFMHENYAKHVLRERQDTKARYEVSSEGVRISNLFANIEANKEKLRLTDYGVSQTSLEQVFNMHAAEAERLKQGHIDG